MAIGGSIYNYEPSWKASGTIAPCRFCTADSSFDEQVKQSGSGDFPIGVSQEGQRDTPGLAGSDTTIAAKSGDVGMRVIGLGNPALLELGGTVTPGFIKPDSNGKGIQAFSGSNDYYGAIALQAGTSGQKIKVIVLPGKA